MDSGATTCDACAPGFVNPAPGATRISDAYLPLDTTSYPGFSAASGATGHGYFTTCIPW